MQPKPKKPPDRSQPHLFSSLLPSSHSLILRLSLHSLNLEIGALCVRICFNRLAPCCQSGSSHSDRSEVTLPCLVLGWSNLGNYSTFGDLRWPFRPQRSPPWKPSPADSQLLSVSLHCRHLVFRFAFQVSFSILFPAPLRALCCLRLYRMESILQSAMFQFGFSFTSVNASLSVCWLLFKIGHLHEKFSPDDFFKAEYFNSSRSAIFLLRFTKIESWLNLIWSTVLLFFLLFYSWTVVMSAAIVPPHICLCELSLPDDLSHPPLAYVVVPCCLCWGHVFPQSLLSLGNCKSRDLCAPLNWKGFTCSHIACTMTFADSAAVVEVSFIISGVSFSSWYLLSSYLGSGIFFTISPLFGYALWWMVVIDPTSSFGVMSGPWNQKPYYDYFKYSLHLWLWLIFSLLELMVGYMWTTLSDCLYRFFLGFVLWWLFIIVPAASFAVKNPLWEQLNLFGWLNGRLCIWLLNITPKYFWCSAMLWNITSDSYLWIVKNEQVLDSFPVLYGHFNGKAPGFGAQIGVAPSFGEQPVPDIPRCCCSWSLGSMMHSLSTETSYVSPRLRFWCLLLKALAGISVFILNMISINTNCESTIWFTRDSSWHHTYLLSECAAKILPGYVSLNSAIPVKGIHIQGEQHYAHFHWSIWGLSYEKTELCWREEHSLQRVSGRRSILQLAFVLMRNCELFYWLEDLNILLCCNIFCITGLVSMNWLLLCLASEGRRGCISFRNSKALFQTAFGLRLQLLWLSFNCLVFSTEPSTYKIFLR